MKGGSRVARSVPWEAEAGKEPWQVETKMVRPGVAARIRSLRGVTWNMRRGFGGGVRMRGVLRGDILKRRWALAKRLFDGQSALGGPPDDFRCLQGLLAETC